MNAIQFIKDHGVEKAREVVEGAPEGATSIIGEMYFRFTDKEYWYWSFSGCKSKGKSEQYFYYQKRTTDLSDLKILVESVDLIKSYGGIINAKHDVKYLDLDWDYDTPRVTRLKQAIADYESIYGGEHV